MAIYQPVGYPGTATLSTLPPPSDGTYSLIWVTDRLDPYGVIDPGYMVSDGTTWDNFIGPTGFPGKSLLNGSGAPSSGTGNNGDFYIDNVAHNIYGPKASGSWPSGVSIIGPAGSAGANGNTILNATSAPSSGTGSNGDFFINTSTTSIYGPKAAGVWPAPISLIGPTGSSGSPGANGATILSSAGTPSSGLGNNGDFCLDVTNKIFYGPKTSGAWGSGFSMIGPTGPSGVTGLQKTRVTTNSSGVATWTFSPAYVAAPTVAFCVEQATSLPTLMNITSISNTSVTVQIWRTQTLPPTLTLLTQLIGFNPFGAAGSLSGVTVDLIAVGT